MDIGEIEEIGHIEPRELPILEPSEDEGAGESIPSVDPRTEPTTVPAEEEYADAHG